MEIGFYQIAVVLGEPAKFCFDDMSFVADGYLCLPGVRFSVLEVSANVTLFCVGSICCRF